MKRLSPLEGWRSDERFRFLVVGGWNTLFGYLAYVVLYQLLGNDVSYLLIGALAHGIAMLNAFACHRLLVFRSRGRLWSDFARFNLSQVTVVALGLVALWCLVSVFGLSPLVAQGLVVVLAVVLSYLAHRHFTFAT